MLLITRREVKMKPETYQQLQMRCIDPIQKLIPQITKLQIRLKKTYQKILGGVWHVGFKEGNKTLTSK